MVPKGFCMVVYFRKPFTYNEIIIMSDIIIIEPAHKKTRLHGFANNKDADQPIHPRRLISVFVVHCLLCIISRLATGETSIF